MFAANVARDFKMSRLFTKYQKEITADMQKEYKYSNPMQIPRVVKVVLNMGVGRGVADSKQIETAKTVLGKIAGQQPVSTKAKKSIAGFKLREGQQIGVMVTLRGAMAHEFIDRLVSVTLPRIRDFRGLNAGAFDGRGGYSLGIRDLGIFPEAANDEGGMSGLQVNIATTAKTDDEARKLLKLMGFPFKKDED